VHPRAPLSRSCLFLLPPSLDSLVPRSRAERSWAFVGSDGRGDCGRRGEKAGRREEGQRARSMSTAPAPKRPPQPDLLVPVWLWRFLGGRTDKKGSHNTQGTAAQGFKRKRQARGQGNDCREGGGGKGKGELCCAGQGGARGALGDPFGACCHRAGQDFTSPRLGEPTTQGEKHKAEKNHTQWRTLRRVGASGGDVWG
jgi:hypothetical protein